MAVNTKIIRRRVKSIVSTKKITKAMELVAAAKMRKTVKAALATRAYAVLAQEMLSRLSQMKDLQNLTFLRAEPVKKILMVVIASNKGLCGGFNTNIFKKTVEQVGQQSKTKVEIEAITVGKRAERMMKKLGLNIIAAFSPFSDAPKILEIMPLAKIVEEEFANKKYEKIIIVYTDYLSAVSQKPKIRQLLPISRTDLKEMLKGLAKQAEISPAVEPIQNIDFIFEPDPSRVLTVMLPRLLETQIYQAVLESSASEHSARMLAMRNASDAAEEMIDDLVFTLNQARQSAITREIAEISGGAAALE